MEHLGFRPFWTEPNLVYVHLTGSRRPDLTEVRIQMFHTALEVADQFLIPKQYSFINIRGNHELIVGNPDELGPE